MKEYEFINIIKSIVDHDLNVIGDDTAVIKDSGLVLTCDTLVEGTHFRLSTTSPFDLGYKAAAVNLSDIATTAGECQYLLVSLALPKSIDSEFIRQFYTGMKTIADEFGVKIVGGDLTSSSVFMVTVTAIGYTSHNVSRSFARVNQKILTTGYYGTSYIGLQILEGLIKTDINVEDVCKKHLRPFPRLKEANYISNILKYGSFCMMDTSDGLADALFQISKKSQKGLCINVETIPMRDDVKDICKETALNQRDVALYGGEDFELLFTCDPDDLEKVLTQTSYSFKLIGDVIEEDSGVDLIYKNQVVKLTEEVLEHKITFKHF